MVSIVSNTNKEYPCTMCGDAGNIVREDPVNPRLKCNSCGFMYDGKDSLEAKRVGAIPDGPPPPIEEDFKEENTYPEGGLVSSTEHSVESVTRRLPLVLPLPRTPTHVLISKDRKHFEFVTKRSLRKEVLKWTAAGTKFDLFELTNKKVDAQIVIN